jgi:hypothetical protein
MHGCLLTWFQTVHPGLIAVDFENLCHHINSFIHQLHRRHHHSVNIDYYPGTHLDRARTYLNADADLWMELHPCRRCTELPQIPAI